jgi:hypothetical protein
MAAWLDDEGTPDPCAPLHIVPNIWENGQLVSRSHKLNPTCWCDPRFDQGVWVHSRTQ